MKDKKTSWDYQKNRPLKQVKITFDLDDTEDALLYRFCSRYDNRTALIKRLLYDELVRCAYEE